jgi:hypothetical protein
VIPNTDGAALGRTDDAALGRTDDAALGRTDDAALPRTDSAVIPTTEDAGPQPPEAAQVPPSPSVNASIPTASATDSPSHLFGYLAVYTLLRLALVAVLTAVLVIFMPLIVALLFAIIIQLPLSWLLFAGSRRRVNEAMARSTAHRRGERHRLQAALSGEEPPA